MYLVPKEEELKDVIAFASSDGLRIDAKGEAEVGGDDSAVVERNGIDTISKDGCQAQVSVISDDEQRRATFSFHLVSTHLLTQATIYMTE